MPAKLSQEELRIRAARSNGSKGGRPRKFTKSQVAQALRKTLGFKTQAARKLGCSLETLNAYLKRYPSLTSVVTEVNERNLDMAEFSLFKQIQKENTQATTFYLERKGQGRGYGNPAVLAKFSQINIGLEGMSWGQIMEKAQKELMSSGATVIDVAPPQKQLSDASASSNEEQTQA